MFCFVCTTGIMTTILQVHLTVNNSCTADILSYINTRDCSVLLIVSEIIAAPYKIAGPHLSGMQQHLWVFCCGMSKCLLYNQDIECFCSSTLWLKCSLFQMWINRIDHSMFFISVLFYLGLDWDMLTRFRSVYIFRYLSHTNLL